MSVIRIALLLRASFFVFPRGSVKVFFRQLRGPDNGRGSACLLSSTIAGH